MTELVFGNLRMRGDRILLAPLDVEFSKIIEVIRHGRPVRGRVLAIGPGIHPVSKRIDIEGGKRRRIEYSKHFRPTEVKVGDIVELGGLNIFDGKGYAFPEVAVNGQSCIICTERDVALVREPEISDYPNARRVTKAQMLEHYGS